MVGQSSVSACLKRNRRRRGCPPGDGRLAHGPTAVAIGRVKLGRREAEHGRAEALRRVAQDIDAAARSSLRFPVGGVKRPTDSGVFRVPSWDEPDPRETLRMTLGPAITTAQPGECCAKATRGARGGDACDGDLSGDGVSRQRPGCKHMRSRAAARNVSWLECSTAHGAAGGAASRQERAAAETAGVH